MARVILHLDLDAFFCAVEEGRDAGLRGKAFAVGGRPEHRGVVSSCSYPARKFGVHSAMPMSQAVRLVPNLIIIPPHFDAYRAASKQVMAYLGSITPMIEQISIDEAFLDVTGIKDAGEGLAKRMQASINGELGLPCSFGVASNKLVAKISNNIGKASKEKSAPPNAIMVVPHGSEAAFLAPLPINELWGVGPKTATELRQMGVYTIGDLARYSPGILTRRFGKQGADILQRAKGIDTRPVETERETKSISKETTFTRDVRSAEKLRQVLRSLADGVGWRLRQEGLQGSTVKIKLRWSDFTTVSRQMSFPHGVSGDDDIYKAAVELFEQCWQTNRAVRLIGVGVSGLSEYNRQLDLWGGEQNEKQRKLQATLDELKSRFGENVIKRGNARDE